MTKIFSFFLTLIPYHISLCSFLFFIFSHISTHKSAEIIPDSEYTAEITPSNTLQHHYHPIGSEVTDTPIYSLGQFQLQTPKSQTPQNLNMTSKTHSTHRLIPGNNSRNLGYMTGSGVMANISSNTQFYLIRNLSSQH